MNRKPKLIYLLVFSFFMCFMFVGYAKLTDALNITGEIEGKPQKDVFITNISNETSNFTLDGFYSTILDQTITLDSNEEATYIVTLYNNNNTSKFIYEGYVCEELPEGIQIKVEEILPGEILEDNCISSLIEQKSYDIFKVTYLNKSLEAKEITSPIKFNYTELTTQIKITIEYEGEEYSKYTEKQDEDVYDNIIFDQIEIDLSDEEKNLVARCNNDGILGITKRDGKNYLTVSNIKNYSNANVGELDITVNLFNSLTEAVNYNEDKFKDDTSPNNFLVLQDINDTIESTTESMIIQENRRYSINLDSKEVIIHKTINNNGKLKIYDDNITRGLITITNQDLIYNNLKNSHLVINNVRLELIDTTRTIFTNNEELLGMVVGHEGLVEVNESELNTNYGYCVYKRSLNVGNSNRVATSHESKIVVTKSSLISDCSNAVRFSDGAGIISLVDSYVSSCEDMPKDSAKLTDPIFVRRHYDEMTSDFDKYYQNAITDVKIYITGGLLVCNSKEKVNHFYSDSKLNARIFYTKSAQFKTIDNLSDKTIAARSNDNSFTYPVAMINGNGASDSDLFIDKEQRLLTNHYLNKDGWYYIRSCETDTDGEYKTQMFINNAIANNQYSYLTRNGKIIRVGDYFEMINFNNPGSYYVNLDDYSGGINYFIGLTPIKTDESQSDYMNIKYLFTFLASCDEYYYNLVSLGNLNNAFHIENRSTTVSPKGHNVGIKLVTTTETGTESGKVLKDKQEQRFTIMKYNHVNTIDDAPPYVFVSQYESIISYYIAKVGKKDSNGNIMWDNDVPLWDTTIKFADKYLKDDGHESVTIPGFLDNSSPYEYVYELYFLSNYTSPKYQRNGWYLWQDSTPKNLTNIWNENEYYNFMYLYTQGKIKKGDNNLDTDTALYVSSNSLVTNYGVVLQSNHLDSDNTNNFGYMRINNGKKIYGLTLQISIPSSNTENNPWLYIRTYGIENGAYVRKDYPIITTYTSGKTPYDDMENGVAYKPYYIQLSKSDVGKIIEVTIMFDAENSNWNLYQITLDPFDNANNDNTLVIKTITLIGEVKEHLK